MASKYFDTFGKRLRILREDLSLSQKDVAHALRQQGLPITNQYISKLERGYKTPSGEIVAGLARVLHTTTDYLLLLTDAGESPDDSEQNDTVHENHVVYEVRSPATRALAQRLLTVFSQLSDDERAYVVELAEALH